MLEIKNLTKIYKTSGRESVTALKNVNLRFGDNGLVFVLGKSGSGKSTMLNVIGGLDSFDDGEIIINGKSSADFSAADFDSYRNTYLGFVFQEFYILDEYTVGKNVALALQLQQKEATPEKVEELLELVDLSGFADRRPSELSGGQKQRVAIARALIKDPQIILADEPTGALDSATGAQVFDTLKKLSKDKLVIVVSHDKEFAETYADRIVELKDGEIVSDKTRSQTTKSGKLSANGIAFINETTVRIPKGKKLTEKELSEINKTLNEISGERYITISDKEQFSELFPKLAEEKATGKTNGFSVTDQKKITGNTENFELIRSRLPFSDILKMALSSFKSKSFRLVITLILAVVSLIAFGFSMVLSGYDKNESYVKTYYEQDAYMMSLSRFEKSGDVNLSLPITDDEIKYLDKYFDGKIIKSYEIEQAETTNLTGKKKVLDTAFYEVSTHPVFKPAEFTGIIECDKGDIDVVYGAFPENSDECCVSDLFADYFIKLGMRIGMEDGSIVKLVVNDYSQLIGKDITVGGEKYEIVGVYKTNYYIYKDSFANYTEDEIASSEELSALKARYTEDENMYMSKLLVKDGYTKSFAIDRYNYAADLYLRSDIEGDGAVFGAKIERDSKYRLKQGEIYLSALYYRNIKYGYASTRSFEQLEAEFVTPRTMTVYLKASDNGMSDTVLYEKKFTVVGIYDDIEILGDPTIVMNYYDFINVIEEKYKPESVLVNANLATDELSAVISDMQENGFTTSARSDDALIRIETLMSRAKTVLYIVSGVSAVFVVLLLFNFISTSIVYKKKEIGILRALGARSIDVMSIFIAEGVLIALIIVALSVPLMIVAANYLTTYLYSVLPIALVTFTASDVLLMTLLTIGIIVISSFVPVFNISRKKPIDAIRN